MKSATILIQKLYDWFVNSMSNLESPFLLVVRLYWGWQISQNGWAKLHLLEHPEHP
jgi:putative oxidoreductase